MTVENEYFVDWQGQVVAWRPPFAPEGLPPDCNYYGRVLADVEAALPDAGLTVYMTWNTRELPRYGPDVVALCIGDEWTRWPHYAHKVRAVFKTHGLHPSLRGSGAGLRTPLQRAGLVQLLRVIVLGLPSRLWQLRWIMTPSQRRGSVAVVPVGTYLADIDVEPQPWHERAVDLCFLGSVEHDVRHRRGVRRLFPSPKTVSRRELLSHVDELLLRRPELRSIIGTVPGFHASTASDAARYTEGLRISKICLAPRGTNIETFRALEGMALGCVVVTERLPPHWFYRGGALVEVREWGELEGVVQRVLGADAAHSPGTRALLEGLQGQWSRQCSPAAVASHVVEVLTSPRRRPSGVSRAVLVPRRRAQP